MKLLIRECIIYAYLIFITLICLIFSFKVKRFKEKHEKDLLSVNRVFNQTIQNNEANIAWKEKYYETVGKWFLEKATWKA